jgi:hypothetical protein
MTTITRLAATMHAITVQSIRTPLDPRIGVPSSLEPADERRLGTRSVPENACSGARRLVVVHCLPRWRPRIEDFFRRKEGAVRKGPDLQGVLGQVECYTGSDRVIRGGAWSHDGVDRRSALQGAGAERSFNPGFDVALVPSHPTTDPCCRSWTRM